MDCIKVINFVPGLGTGGIGILMREWYKRKYENVVFDIATIGKGMVYDSLTAQSCRIYEFEPISDVGIVKYVKNAYRIIKAKDYDIVHAHVGMISGFVFVAAILAGKKRRILHAHGIKYNQDDGSFVNTVVTKLLKRASVLLATDYFACSQDAANYLFGKKTANKRARIIHNGIDLDRFCFREKRKQDKKTIGYVARFEKSKNHVFLVDVLARLIERKQNVELLLIGGGDPSEVVSHAERLGVRDSIRIVEPQENIEDYYHEMSVFAFPSLYEGLGIVAIEAQACGTPTIISPGVPKEAIVSSFAKQAKLDVDLWATLIEEMIHNDRSYDAKQEIINNGYDIVSSSRALMDEYIRGL